MERWTPWIPFGEMPDKSFEDFEIRYRDAWSIVIHGRDYLHCAVYNGDTNLLYTDENLKELRLVGFGITKFPWNAGKIKKERKFLEDVAGSLMELEQKVNE